MPVREKPSSAPTARKHILGPTPLNLEPRSPTTRFPRLHAVFLQAAPESLQRKWEPPPGTTRKHGRTTQVRQQAMERKRSDTQTAQCNLQTPPERKLCRNQSLHLQKPTKAARKSSPSSSCSPSPRTSKEPAGRETAARAQLPGLRVPHRQREDRN